MTDLAAKQTHEGSTEPGRTAAGTAYRIKVKGAIDDRWSSYFEGLQISHDADGDTTLAGRVRDQAALHGLLAKVRDLGLTLLAVEPRVSEPVGTVAENRVRTGSIAADARRNRTGSRSPVPAIVGSIAAGLALALALVLGPASGGTESTVTGSILLAFGIGWGVMAFATTRFSSQPQSWMQLPAAALGLVGLTLVVIRPGREAMDLLAWVWPVALAALAIWMFVQVRANVRGRGRWLLVPVIAVLMVFSIGGGLTTVASAVGGTAAPQTGQLVDVGGRQLYIECRGTGSPAVILQAGMNGSAADWSRIVPTAAASTTVCSYDRAGHGWSDPAANAQDGTAIAADLHTLLERAGIAGPYVLVGHSSGGPYMRVFAASYPDEVAGMVLLDAQPADAFTALPEYPAFYGPYRAVLTLAPSLARVGLGIPLLGSPADPSGVRTANSMRDEVIALPAALEQAQRLTTIGDRPLVVVSAGSDLQAGWPAAQARLADLSTNVSHRVIATGTHESLLVGADAPASSQAILDVVAAVRTGSRVR